MKANWKHTYAPRTSSTSTFTENIWRVWFSYYLSLATSSSTVNSSFIAFANGTGASAGKENERQRGAHLLHRLIAFLLLLSVVRAIDSIAVSHRLELLQVAAIVLIFYCTAYDVHSYSRFAAVSSIKFHCTKIRWKIFTFFLFLTQSNFGKRSFAQLAARQIASSGVS